MNILMSDLVRGIVSSVMNILLLFSLAKPKYNKHVTNLVMLVILVADVLTSLLFYLSRDLTKLANFSFLWFLLIYIVLKPLFLDSFMQWMFNLITVINVYAAIVVLSYHLCYYLPYPPYAITLIRFVFFVAVILLFRYWLRPLYRQAVTNWRVFFLLVTGILVNISYYFVFSSDIEVTLREDFLPLLLLIILSIFGYVCIFYSLKITSVESALREENIKTQAREDLLHSELSAYEEFIDITRQHRHDLRHHNALLQEMLSRGEINAALTYLSEYNDSVAEVTLQQYCNNPVANAIFQLYKHRTEAAYIDFTVKANITKSLPLAAPELGGMLSNLLENAWESCQGCIETSRFITVSADSTENQLFLEVKNSVKDTVRFNDGLPVSTKESGGVGIKSVMRIVQNHSGMCRFKQAGKEFLAQIVIPLQ